LLDIQCVWQSKTNIFYIFLYLVGMKFIFSDIYIYIYIQKTAIYIYIYVCVCVCIYIYIHIYIHIHIHTYTHTHSHTKASLRDGGSGIRNPVRARDFLETT
jgi:hypothetical protein